MYQISCKIRSFVVVFHKIIKEFVCIIFIAYFIYTWIIGYVIVDTPQMVVVSKGM